MIGNEVIEADLLADMLAQASITSLLSSAVEIREDQYQGTVFAYPAIRFAVLQQTASSGTMPALPSLLDATRREHRARSRSNLRRS